MFVTQTPQFVSLADLGGLYQKWHRARFGDRPIDLTRTLLKVNEEVGEANEAYSAYLKVPEAIPASERHAYIAEAERRVAEECADVVACCFHLCRGLSVPLENAILRKLQVVWDRLHGPALPPPAGPSTHLAVGLPHGESPLSPTWYDESRVATETSESIMERMVAGGRVPAEPGAVAGVHGPDAFDPGL